MNPSGIMGAEDHPNMIVIQNESVIFIIELTVGFETNIDLNAKWKANNSWSKFENMNFINVSMGPWV